MEKARRSPILLTSLLACTGFLLVMGPVDPVEACSIAAPGRPTKDTRFASEESGILQIQEVQITRGISTVHLGCGSSCDDLGLVSIALTMPGVAPQSPCDFGFSLTLQGGTLPAGLVLPTDIVGLTCNPKTTERGFLTLVWIDESRNDQDPFSFELQLRAVDGQDRSGPPTIIALAHDGKVVVDPNRCSGSGVPTQKPPPSGDQDPAPNGGASANASSPEQPAHGCALAPTRTPPSRSVGLSFLFLVACLLRPLRAAHRVSGSMRLRRR